MQVLHGDAISVLEKLDKESIDTVYMCPSPCAYYENEPDYIGGEKGIEPYLDNLVNVCNACRPVLKPSGNLFIQLGDQFNIYGYLVGIPVRFEGRMVNNSWILNDRLFWHRTETYNSKKSYDQHGFRKNYEYIFHFIKDSDKFYFNTNSKYCKTSVFSYPLEDTYYTNEFDSGLPYQLSEMVIDTTCPPNGIVLDPLAGSGKFGVVAKKMNRDFIMIDINFECCESMKARLGI